MATGNRDLEKLVKCLNSCLFLRLVVGLIDKNLLFNDGPSVISFSSGNGIRYLQASQQCLRLYSDAGRQ